MFTVTQPDENACLMSILQQCPSNLIQKLNLPEVKFPSNIAELLQHKLSSIVTTTYSSTQHNTDGLVLPTSV